MLRSIGSLTLVMMAMAWAASAVEAHEGCSCGKCEGCFRIKLRRPCLRCRKPKMNCCCTPVQMVPKPVYETCYRKEQEVVQRQFVETHMRDETYTEQVPVTKYDCITVDEGCYQQIWVPKLVTKQIPRTEMVCRTACRQVPYQVTRCVPEVTTRMVPYQRVRYVMCPSTCVAGLTLGGNCGASQCGPSCGATSCGASPYGPQPSPPAGPANLPPTGNTQEPVPAPVAPAERAVAPESSSLPVPADPVGVGTESTGRQPAQLGAQINPVSDPQYLDLPVGSQGQTLTESSISSRISRPSPKFRPASAPMQSRGVGVGN